ncbi:MAG: hypothetical protein E6J41_28400 [Chloroflexi bacterium]|nr:MAG: hypothetical protein E6J41_28400 [Chloroflexota bacterium]
MLTDSLDLLCERVRELESALKGLIDECLFQGDSRKPRPALAHADTVLCMRDRRPASGHFDPVQTAGDFTVAEANRDLEASRHG